MKSILKSLSLIAFIALLFSCSNKGKYEGKWKAESNGTKVLFTIEKSSGGLYGRSNIYTGSSSLGANVFLNYNDKKELYSYQEYRKDEIELKYDKEKDQIILTSDKTSLALDREK